MNRVTNRRLGSIDPFGEMRMTMAAGADNRPFFVSTQKAAHGARDPTRARTSP